MHYLRLTVLWEGEVNKSKIEELISVLRWELCSMPLLANRLVIYFIVIASFFGLIMAGLYQAFYFLVTLAHIVD